VPGRNEAFDHLRGVAQVQQGLIGAGGAGHHHVPSAVEFEGRHPVVPCWPVFQRPTDARRQLREREIPPLDRPHLEPIGQFGPLRVCFLEGTYSEVL